MIRKVAILLMAGIVWCLHANAQYYETGREQPSINWMSIKSAHFQVLVPEAYLGKGKKVAVLLENYYTKANEGLKPPRKKHVVVVHPYSSLSNGYVAWAPSRVELYPLPSQGMYSQEWLSQLTLHEFRHLVQIENMEQGFTKILSVLLGQQATAAVLGLFIPPWFLEGDAVWTETYYSKSGRGRMPDFSAGFKALVVEKGVPSMNKAMFGSFRHYIPDHYELGYHWVTFVREKYGEDTWESVLRYVARNPWYPWPFARALKKYTGKPKRLLYKECMMTLDSIQRQTDIAIDSLPATAITGEHRGFVSYSSALVLNDSMIVAMKSSLDRYHSVVSIENGKEKKLFSLGSNSSRLFASDNGVIVWSEYAWDPVYENRSYSEVWKYDVKTGKKKRISKKTLWYSPDISATGDRIIVSAMSADGGNSIQVFRTDAPDSVVTFSIPDTLVALSPVYEYADTSALFIVISPQGRSIYRLRLMTGEISEILGPVFYTADQLSTLKEGFLYMSDENGKSDICFYNYRDNQSFRITDSQFSASDPVICPGGKSFLYSDYHSDGYRLCILPLDTTLQNVTTLHSTKIQHYFMPEVNIIPIDTAIELSVRKYHKSLNLFRLHSWGPVSTDVESQRVNPGFTLLSQNSLSTMFADAGYEYDIKTGVQKYTAGIKFRGWDPDVSLRANYSLEDEQFFDADSLKRVFTRQISDARASLSLPWYFRKSYWITMLQSSASIVASQTEINEVHPEETLTGNVNLGGAGISFSNYTRSSQRDLSPKFGQMLLMQYRTTLLGDRNAGDAMVTRGALLFPGIFRNNSLFISASYEGKRPQEYILSNSLDYPAGIIPRNYENYTAFSARYSAPLLYPDISMGSLLYLKRIKASLFCEYGNAKISGKYEQFSSVGSDVTADVHILRFLFPFNVGIRTVYIPRSGEIYTQFLFFMGITY
ncbi:MAG: DUF2268 domain-containing protein [Bacteroidetes bacterium]|nr:DUF2268 domain-containing protein [Bacteroidota bacterium]MBU1719822.1 DUF2268 domain-containing protein [Bacteroidota bacterium]